jgi:hypothetical protein
MKSLFVSFSLGSILLVAATAISGCGIGTQINASPAVVTMAGGLSGNNFGGHAPIVGAKVFLLQAGTSGYGSKSTSLLTSAAGGTDTTLVGSTLSPAYYTTTDLSGYFTFTGDYTCTAGLPVYLYAVGGSPDVDPAAGHSYLKSASGDGSTTTFVVDQEKMYVGQSVMITGIPSSNPFVSLNGTLQTVTAVSASDNKSFSIASNINASSTDFGTISVASPVGTVNPAIANVAVLGNCPSSAPYTFGAGSSNPINFVYMNEVSTVAGMFALAPFAQTSAGVPTDAQHIGIPASDALALTGIQNAAVNAGQLYDISGMTNNANTSDGEGHIARAYVPNSAANANAGAYVTVPQALIDTLGNILAQCVDSANTAGIGVSGGTYSPACRILFENATSDGKLTGSLGGATNPLETATAALNIAHYPAGNGNASFTSNLANLPTGVVPFQPTLNNTPNDFMIGLNITDTSTFLGSNGGTNAKPNGIALDGNGNAFVTTTGCNGGCTLQVPPTQLPANANISYTAGATDVAVDPTGRVWVVNGSQSSNGGNGPSGGFYVNSTLPISANSFTGYGTTSSFATGTVTIAIDGNGVAYVADSGENYIHKIAALGTAPAFTQYLIQGPTYPDAGTRAGQQNCETDVVGIAIDSQAAGYNIWTVDNADTLTQGMCTISNVATTAATTATSPMNVATVLSQIGPTYSTGGLAIDANGSAWDSNSLPPNISAAAFAATFGGEQYSGDYGFAGGGGLSGDFGVAIDGNNNAWYANQTGNSVSLFKNLGAPTFFGSQVGSAISPSAGYTAGGTMCSPQKIAIDASGDVWVTNNGTNCTATGGLPVTYSVTELIGVAAPTYMPLSSAALNNKLGGRP